MDAKSGALDFLNGLRRSAEPLKLVLRDKDAANRFLRDFGWVATITDADLAAIRGHWGFEPIFTALNAAAVALENNSPNVLQLTTDLLNAIDQLVTLLSGNPGAGALPFPFNQPAFWNEIPRPLIDRLTYEGLMTETPLLGASLFTLGILDHTPVTPIEPGRAPFVRYHVQWEHLGALLSKPGKYVQDTYQWGSNSFRHDRFLEAVELLFGSLHFAARREPPMGPVRDAYFAPANPLIPNLQVLKVPIVLQIDDGFADWVELGFQMMPITPAGQLSDTPSGFFVAPLVKGAITANLLPDTAPVALTFTGGFETDGGFRLEVRPTGLDLTVSAGGTTITAILALVGAPPTPYVLLGTAGSHRIELEGFRVALGVKGNLTDPEFIAEAGTGTGLSAPRLRFILQAQEGDGFIRDLLGDKPVSLDLAFMLTWSSKSGFGISGNVGFTIEIPLHLALGPILLESVKVSAGVDLTGEARVGVGVNIGAKLGPLTVVVDNIGAKLLLVTAGPNKPAVLGNLALDWGFQPPNGLGLGIKAASFSGGGYISFDFEKGRYTGILELTFSGVISLKAIGILNTIMPDGRTGFSLLLIITAEFTPIQLGYGFTLNGVGGLIGINRTMRLDALREGVYNGSLNSILFPVDIIANANRIIADSERIFPMSVDRFVFGPMAKIGWGTPTLISLELGLIIEVPSPLRIALLGVLKCILPAEEFDILRLQVNFLGALDMEAQMLSFDASLFNSRLLIFNLTGDMAIRLKWGDDPNFLMTVGGFHPSFQPPPLALPPMRRLGLSLLEGDNPKLALECYFAITSNTVQVGARIELKAKAGPFSVYGFLGFDALFQFSPFYFIVSVGAMLEVRSGAASLFCLSLEFQLSGTTPWHAEGSASFRILFVRIRVGFNETWGEEKDTALPDAAVLPALRDALSKKGNWQAALPPGNTLSVSLVEIPASGEDIVAHPAGTLRLSQKIVPLDLAIQKFGAVRPTDAKLFRIESAASGTSAFSLTDVREDFAPAQFFEMDNAAKLARKSFEKLPSGKELRVGTGAWATSRVLRRLVVYERIIVDTLYRRYKPVKAAIKNFEFIAYLNGNAAALSAKGTRAKAGTGAPSKRASVVQEGFAVVDATTLQVFDAQSQWGSEMEARDYADRLVQSGNASAKSVQVVPSYETADAA